MDCRRVRVNAKTIGPILNDMYHFLWRSSRNNPPPPKRNSILDKKIAENRIKLPSVDASVDDESVDIEDINSRNRSRKQQSRNRMVKEDGDEVVVELERGDVMRAKKVVVATEGPQAAKLLGSALERAPSQFGDPVGTACLYFSADEPPRKGNYLYLDGDNKGSIVNNCCVPSEVTSSYAPPGKSLISVSVISTRPDLDDQELQRQVLDELSGWFGRDKVSGWPHLRTYRIPFSQPPQTPPTDLFKPLKLTENIYVAGDHRMTATLDGALWSGRLVAESIAESIAGSIAGSSQNKS